MKLDHLPAELLADRPHLFSPAVVEITRDDLARMRALVVAIEQVVARPEWRENTHVGAPGGLPSAEGWRADVAGVFMGYDFHLTPEGPRLIEINTNAGGGLLAALQAGNEDALTAFVDMFRRECPGLERMAIVDDAPATQFLYPEFIGFRQLLAEHGIEVAIGDPAALRFDGADLWLEGLRVDLVYNRLTDFDLSQAAHETLREAWLRGIAVTPNPQTHAAYADKRNLIALSDDTLLSAWGVSGEVRAVLAAGIPRTESVVPGMAEDFWTRRRTLFFKPATGYGSKGAYRGDKLTKRVFEEILAGDYVAQAMVPPSQVDGLKLDVRNYAYRGEVQLVAARLYQGQTTNFRTPGGGFAKVMER